MTTVAAQRAGFSPEVFARFWAAPNPEAVPDALTEDVVERGSSWLAPRLLCPVTRNRLSVRRAAVRSGM